VCGVLGGVEDLLEHARNRGDHGGAHHSEFLAEMGDVRGEAGSNTHLEPEQQIALRERVGQGQEQESDVVGADLVADRIDGLRHVGTQIAVREHASLRSTRRAGGVDDRCRVVGPERLAAPSDLAVIDVDAEPLEFVEPRGTLGGLDREDVAASRCMVVHAVVEGAHLVGLDDRDDGTTVLEDPGELLGRGCLVDRHGDGAGRHDRHVDDDPFQAGVRHQRDPIAGFDAARHEALGHVAYPIGELRARPVDEPIALAGHRDDAICVLVHQALQWLQQVGAGTHPGERRSIHFGLHGPTSRGNKGFRSYCTAPTPMPQGSNVHARAQACRPPVQPVEGLTRLERVNDVGLGRMAGSKQKELVMAALGIFLIVAGAIIVWGVEVVVEGFDLQAIGYILMVGGAIALVVAAIRGAGWMSMGNRNVRSERVASPDGTHVVEQTETH
jgi:hypothetical protein